MLATANFQTFNAPDTCIITANSRLSLYYQRQFNQTQTNKNNAAWPTPAIFSLSQWQLATWHDFCDLGLAPNQLVLSSFQQHLLWKKIIEDSHYATDLLNITQTANTVATAWQLLKTWAIPLNNEFLNATDDSRAFHTWAKTFEKYCQTNHCVDKTQLLEILLPLIKSNPECVAKNIVLIGFDIVPPILQTLISTLKSCQKNVEFYQAEIKKSQCHSIGLASVENEILTMARWALRQHQCDPQLKITCIVPDLPQHRTDIHRIFTQQCGSQLFNISIGLNLQSYPIVANALLSLKLIFSTLTAPELSLWLRSPYLNQANDEMSQRGILDNTVRKEGFSHIELKTLLSLSQHITPQLYQQLSIIPVLKAEQQLPSKWAIEYRELLHLLAWPGERQLNSLEYQCLQRFLKLVDEFSRADFILNKITAGTALNVLTELCQQTIFQPEGSNQPIQILGILEATGQLFDKVWVMGLDDNHWPAKPKPNPFIPLSLQRQFSMPHATAERELFIANNLTQRILQSADEVIFSFSTHLGDQALTPSPLITGYPEQNINDLALTDEKSLARELWAHQDLELVEDEVGPEIFQVDITSGGAGIFQAQAQCPFKAFAKYRLLARSLDIPALGFTAIERGNIVHHCLEIVWGQLKNQTTLHQISVEDLNALLKEAIHKAINSILAKKQQTFSSTYLTIERKRLRQLLMRWLILEKQRPNFQIQALEHSINTSVGNLSIKLRVDRIDELDDGSHLIIDYKTGDTSTKVLFGQRPDQPQLPLYCISAKTKVTGLAFAVVRQDSLIFKGISDQPIDILGITPFDKVKDINKENNWQLQLDAWQSSLLRLGEEFSLGHAKVLPKNGIKTCQHCDFHTLCRIHQGGSSITDKAKLNNQLP